MCIDDINNLRVIENVPVPFDCTGDMDALVKSSALALDEVYILEDDI